MQTDEAMPDKCGARNRNGTRCKRRAGWGTDHVGTGRCSYHTGATINGRKAAAKQEALHFTRYALGAEAPIDALDAQVLSVHLANGVVEFWRAKLAESDQPSQATMIGYNDALAQLNRFSRNAIESKVAERLARISERQAEAIVLVCEAGLAALIAAGLKLSNTQRTAFAKGVERALADREALPVIEA
jgi:hypothetical protein